MAVLYGVSGIGKSSLLEAGLFPLLRDKGMLPIRIRLDFSDDARELLSQIKNAIAGKAVERHVEPPPSSDLETLWEYFHRRDQNFWDERNRLITPVLIFDQFEELFTLGSSKGILSEAAREFVTQLADLAEGHPPDALQHWLEEHPDGAAQFNFRRHPYRILISMREDFLAQLDDFRSLMPSIASSRKRLLPMDGQAALQVVNQAPDLISAAVAEEVVRFVGAADSADRDLSELIVDPALLSVMCSELNEKRKARGDATITASLVEGNREQILRDFYERTIGDVNAAARIFVEEKLIVDPGYRDTVAVGVALQTPGVTRDDIDRLVSHRLIRIEQRGAVRRIELTHDLLVGVILESRNKRHIEERAEAEKAARIEAEGRERQARRKLHRAQLFILVFVALSVIAAGAAVIAFWAQVQANRNRQMAEDATDKLAGIAGAHSVEVPAEPPDTLSLREQLLKQAQTIYGQFNHQDQKREDVRKEVAMGHVRSADLCRLRGDTANAIGEYTIATQQLTALVHDFPRNQNYTAALGDAYNWRGETERLAGQSASAQADYNSAVSVQSDKNSLGQTYNNRGILKAAAGRNAEAEADYKRAIQILTPLVPKDTKSDAADMSRQGLARTQNNLAQLIYNESLPEDAATLYDQAIANGEVLASHSPNNGEYQVELAVYYNNSAIMLEDSNPAAAMTRNQRAIDLMNNLVQPVPYLNMRLGWAHSIRGFLFDNAGAKGAENEYQEAVNTFKSVPNKIPDQDFHLWFGQALMKLAEGKTTSAHAAIQLLQQAVQEHNAAGPNYYNLAWDYCYLASAYARLNMRSDIQQARRSADGALSHLPKDQKEEVARQCH